MELLKLKLADGVFIGIWILLSLIPFFIQGAGDIKFVSIIIWVGLLFYIYSRVKKYSLLPIFLLFAIISLLLSMIMIPFLIFFGTNDKLLFLIIPLLILCFFSLLLLKR